MRTWPGPAAVVSVRRAALLSRGANQSPLSMRRLPPLPRRRSHASTRAEPGCRPGHGRRRRLGRLAERRDRVHQLRPGKRAALGPGAPERLVAEDTLNYGAVASTLACHAGSNAGIPARLEDRLHGAEQPCGDGGMTQGRGRARHAGKRGCLMIQFTSFAESGQAFAIPLEGELVVASSVRNGGKTPTDTAAAKSKPCDRVAERFGEPGFRQIEVAPAVARMPRLPRALALR